VWRALKEMNDMVHKETCPACRGNRWITVKDSTGHDVHKKCPQCGGQGYKVHIKR
jgi:excinuclease UvrABC ATPase subunit